MEDNKLFRDIPGYNQHSGDLDPTAILAPLDTGKMARASEYFIIVFATIIGLWLLYWIGRWIQKRRLSKN